MNFVELQSQVDYEYILKEDTGKKYFLFSTSWCQPCQKLKQKLTDYAAEHKHRFTVYVLTPDDQNIGQALAEQYQVGKYPTSKFGVSLDDCVTIQGVQLGKIAQQITSL